MEIGAENGDKSLLILGSACIAAVRVRCGVLLRLGGAGIEGVGGGGVVGNSDVRIPMVVDGIRWDVAAVRANCGAFIVLGRRGLTDDIRSTGRVQNDTLGNVIGASAERRPIELCPAIRGKLHEECVIGATIGFGSFGAIIAWAAKILDRVAGEGETDSRVWSNTRNAVIGAAAIGVADYIRLIGRVDRDARGEVILAAAEVGCPEYGRAVRGELRHEAVMVVRVLGSGAGGLKLAGSRRERRRERLAHSIELVARIQYRAVDLILAAAAKITPIANNRVDHQLTRMIVLAHMKTDLAICGDGKGPVHGLPLSSELLVDLRLFEMQVL